MDSPADNDYDIDAELAAWLEKEAAENGLDPSDPYGSELEVIRRFQQNPNPEDFETLYNAHRPLINSASRIAGASTLPKAALHGEAIKHYTDALMTWSPERSAFSSWVFSKMRRLGRYSGKYSNIGKVPEERATLVPLLQQTESNLQEQLGRPPSDHELADEMLMAAQDVASLKAHRITPKVVGTLRREMRKDLTAEQAGGEAVLSQDSQLRRKVVFLHGSLNPEQQLVLEHTFEGFGKPVIEDDAQLAQQVNMSPQKVRAIKAQIRKKVERYW